MTFIHQSVPKVDLHQVTTEKGRYYELPNGDRFASVTTILDRSDYFDKSWLASWIARVGPEAAAMKKRRALERGETIHRMAEKFLHNDPDYKKGEMPFDIDSFIKIREHLKANVGVIFGVEIPLYSYTWKTAGKSDLICRWKRRKTVVDFKTSTNPKEEKDIENYFVQSSVYGLMFNELYPSSEPVEDIAVILINDESRYPQIFEKKISDFMPQIQTIFKDNECLSLLFA